MTTSAAVRLDPDAAETLLSEYGIPMPAQGVARDCAGAVEAAVRIGFPVALKIIAEGVSHKSDIDGVRLRLTSEGQVESAFHEVVAALERACPGARVDGVHIQRMVPGGVEMFVGAKRDALWGPLVLCGVGGVFVELVDDVVVCPAPLTPAGAAAMVDRLKAAPVLAGYRGGAAADRQALMDVLLAIGRLVVDRPDVVEIDLNPILVGAPGEGVVAVDARVVLGSAEAASGAPAVARAATVDAPTAVERMLTPSSLVIVGASSSPQKIGGRLLRYVTKHGYAGRVYLVNPHEGGVPGWPVYKSIGDLPEVPDLACVAVPERAALDVINECGAAGIRAAIVYTSGFGETGEAGGRREAERAAAARRHGVRMCGPNTVGVVSPASRCCPAFGMALELDPSVTGDIALVTQSGALGGSILSRCWAQGIGISRWVCSGNEADLTVADYLEYLVDDEHTRVIMLFLESIRDPDGFRHACRRAVAAGKPVIAYKTGRSAGGARAVQSHSGAIAGDAAVYDAVFRSLGVVQVHDLQSLMDVAQGLSWQPAPKGRRIAVLSTSGGACSIIADECAKVGLEIPPLNERTRRRVAAAIPEFGVSDNPVDLTAQVMVNPGMFAHVLDALLEESAFDALVMMLTTNADPAAIEVARSVVASASRSGKPTLVVRTGAESLAPRALEVYAQGRVPVFPMPDRAVRALRGMVAWTDAGREG